MRLRPLNDRVVVLPDDPETTSPGGVIIPDIAQQAPQRGVVISVGPGRVLDSGEKDVPDVKKGDVVLYSRHGASEFEIGSVTFTVVTARDIFAVVEKDEK